MDPAKHHSKHKKPGTALVAWTALEDRWAKTVSKEQDVHAERGKILMAAQAQAKAEKETWKVACKKHFDITDDAASKYIRIAKASAQDDTPVVSKNVNTRAKAAAETLGTSKPGTARKAKITDAVDPDAPPVHVKYTGPPLTETQLSRKQALTWVGITGDNVQISSETLDVIFRGLAQRWHPDKGESSDKEAFLLLNKAKKILL